MEGVSDGGGGASGADDGDALIGKGVWGDGKGEEVRKGDAKAEGIGIISDTFVVLDYDGIDGTDRLGNGVDFGKERDDGLFVWDGHGKAAEMEGFSEIDGLFDGRSWEGDQGCVEVLFVVERAVNFGGGCYGERPSGDGSEGGRRRDRVRVEDLR